MIIYNMRGYHTVLDQLVSWDSYALPDFGAVMSGYVPSEIENICVVGRQGSLGAPIPRGDRVASDANTYLYWTFTEDAPPYVNLGSAGFSGNLVASFGSVGSGWASGRSGPVFGDGGSLIMNETITPGFRIQAADIEAWPSTEITVAVWHTPTLYSMFNNYGRIFFKSWTTGWSAPYASVQMQYQTNITGGLGMGFLGGPTIYPSVGNEDILTPLNTPCLLGFTYDETDLYTYVNGRNIGIHNSPGTLAGNLGTGPWIIGNTPNNLGERVGGFIEEIRVDTVVRDQSWWTNMWNQGMGRP